MLHRFLYQHNSVGLYLSLNWNPLSLLLLLSVFSKVSSFTDYYNCLLPNFSSSTFTFCPRIFFYAIVTDFFFLSKKQCGITFLLKIVCTEFTNSKSIVQKVPAAKSNNLSSIPGSSWYKRTNTLKLSSDLQYMAWHTYPNIYTLTHKLCSLGYPETPYVDKTGLQQEIHLPLLD